MRMIKSVAALLLLAAGCGAESGGSLVITDIAAPDDECKYSNAPKDKVSGDVFDAAAGVGYFMAPLVRNDMLVDTDNALPISRDVVVSGFKACWFEVGELSGQAAHDLRCADLPGSQKAFYPAAGTVPAGGETGVFTFAMLEPAALAGMWSGGVPPDPYGTGIVVKLQAVGRTKSGDEEVLSNWLSFGIDVCSDCLLAQHLSLCGGTSAYECFEDDCHPFQGSGGAVTCVTGTGCKTTTAPSP